MFDNHTFERLPDKKAAAAKRALELFDIDPYGMVGQEIDKGKEMPPIHAMGRERRGEFVRELESWSGVKLGAYAAPPTSTSVVMQLKQLAAHLEKNSKDLDPEFAAVVDKHFWDLLA